MTTIGGKTKLKKASQPQVVVRASAFTNEYLLLGMDEKNIATLRWVGDPNAATHFNSKYEAKARIRDMADLPGTRVYEVL